MTATLLRLLVFLLIAGFVYFGVRRIWRDWSSHFRVDEKRAREKARQRDLSERQRPDVIELKRSDDGVFRPKDDDKGS